MADNIYTPDLNSVLQTLSSLTSSTSSSQNASPSQPAPEIQIDPRRQPRRPENFQHPQSYSTRTSATPTTDPATITTWPAALRHVMHTVGQDEEVQFRVRGLIRSQHSHERQCWKGREALVQRHMARGDKKKELDAVLRSIGAPVDSKDISTDKENQAELANYDAKVYKASAQMADALNAELRGLKIPFFAIRQDLVRESSTNVPVAAKGENIRSEGESSKLSKIELVALQQRMLELLEDLCKE